MDAFSPATRAWFEQSFEGPTAVQVQGWPRIAAGEHSLLLAPTGSGKTLAAFLWCIDRLIRVPERGAGVKVLYISPLKALVYDVERNLRAPLRGIARTAELQGRPVLPPRVDVRTGDTAARDRRQQAKDPGDILVTTPESLYLLLGSQARETLRTVDTVIVDEVHALAPTKRGAHLSLSLERLTALCAAQGGHDPQRVGLSATARPLEEVARFLGGDRAVSIIDTSEPPKIDLRIIVPVPDMTRPAEGLQRMLDEYAREQEHPDSALDAPAPPPDEALPFDLAAAGLDPEDLAPSPSRLLAQQQRSVVAARWARRRSADEPSSAPPIHGPRAGSVVVPAPAPTGESPEHSIWPAVYPRLLDLIAEHRTTIVFVNSRGLCERLAQRLNELCGEDLVRAHHGSVSHRQRAQIEEMLKAGQIRAIVATSSLELGIDMGTVDLVVLVESPGAVSRGLQRVGRAGHGVGQVSVGRLFPKHRGDLLESAVVARRMAEGAIEPLRVPHSPLDVLAQQIVAMVGVEPWALRELERTVRRSACFAHTPRDAFVGVLDMLSGRYPSGAFADLRPRIVWNRDTDELSGRRGANMLALVSGGTIPNRGTYGMFMGEGGPRVGELDEEMVHETLPGQNIMLGSSTWRVEHITRDRVIVSPAPGEPGRLPFWRGDGPGRPIELGRALGAFTRELTSRDRGEAEPWLQQEYGLDELAAKNLLDYVHEQRAATGVLPTDRAITIERFRDELGDWRVCILSPLGARVHAPWALCLQTRLEARFGFEVQALWSDDGIVIRLVEVDEVPELEVLLPAPEEVEEQVVQQLAHSALFAGQFRENAARALLLPRKRPNERQPLWAQRLKAQQLLAVAREYPAFPIIMETYRACLQDVFDLPSLVELMQGVQRRQIRVDVVETPSPSPFARSLVFAYVANFLYEGDAPLAERKAQALALDRQLLRELLGREELRELLDAAVIDDVQAEQQGLAEARRAHHADGLHDLLRRVGDLGDDELRARCTEDPQPWLKALEHSRRAVSLRLCGQPRWIAIEDAGLYRDALGALPPPGVPAPFLEDVPDALDQLVARYARTHGPFVSSAMASRYALPPGQVADALRRLETKGVVLSGEFRPGGHGREWCDAEILRQIKRRTLAKLRGEIAPVEAAALGRFLPEWHGIGEGRRGIARLEEVLMQLEGLPLSYAELEQVILPARVPDFAPRMLDELGAMGWLVWVGRGALGKTDGRVALHRRERVSQSLTPPQPPDDVVLDELHQAILRKLEQRGACFMVELHELTSDRDALQEALWDLVWWGLVTNDTFAALRAHARPPARRVGKRGHANAGGGGRWSLVASLLHGEVGETTRAHARAVTLLERYGVVTRETAAYEELPGGFSAIYGVLKAMEEAGKVRRGYFVAGLGGAQFASPGAVDRLRAVRDPDEDQAVVVLSALDPANPYGWLLPWPVRGDDRSGGGPRRVAGASVVLVGGEAVLYLDKGGKRLVTFPAADEPEKMEVAARALVGVAARHRGRMLRVETIDGEAARVSRFADALRGADFRSDVRGLTLEAAR
ncbi:Lhr family helicase [Paraliomyxa miuraensis]|uniref:Lhr family helicase n=1 Tax=Paraliomyxa miuraensis TaxID=376150 RepID=UPI0022554428|nr:DEAD/DEAH box helicase [Paraliomyxa miuraensis]MCX4247691.1 DEAD/DEAH box helicase [Paraliomyxa miuraensis]